MKVPLIMLSILLLYGILAQGQEKEKDSHNSHKSKSNDADNYFDPKDYCDSCNLEGSYFYDFNCKAFYVYKNSKLKPINPNKFNIKYNKELRFTILHVNRYIYDVGITVDDITFGSESPAIFNQLFLGSGDFVTGLLSKLSAVSPNLLDENDPVNKFIIALTNFKASYDKLLETQIKAYSLCNNDIKCCEKSSQSHFTELSTLLFNLKKDYLSVQNEFVKKISKTNTQIKESEDGLGKQQAELKDLQEKLKAANTDALRRVIQSKIDNLTPKIDSTKRSRDAAQEDLKLAQSSQAEVEKLFFSFTKITDEDLMKLILFNNNFIRNHFYYKAPPIYPQGNQLDITFGITVRDSSLTKKWNINPIYNDSIFLSLPVIGKPFVIFSTGPFLGLSNKIRNELYGLQAQPNANGLITDSAKYKVVNAGTSSKPVGIAGLATIGAKFSKVLGLGVSLGAGITIEPKPRPNYLAGVSLFGGGRQQFNLSIGINMLQVDKLQTELYPAISTTLYDSKPELQYKRKTAIGAFLSLTYSVFTLGNSRNIKSSSNK